MITHASSFTGIGGFDLAAEAVGWKNEFQIEINKWCIKILTKNFPEVTRYDDIKQFNGTYYKGKIDVYSGGFPCQPVSVAGKQAGDEDIRWLWPEMYRTIREIEPPFVVAENVPGLLSAKQGILFEQVCTDLENAGYQVQPFIIPAASKNAPHKRDRVWIIAYNEEWFNRKYNTKPQERQKQEFGKSTGTNTISEKHASIELSGSVSTKRTATNNFNIWGRKCRSNYKEKKKFEFISDNKYAANPNNTSTNDRIQTRRELFTSKNWENWTAEPPVCGVDDGVPYRVDRIKGLGNAIVPQLAFENFTMIDNFIKNAR